MSGRPTLYGPDGVTPIATEETVARDIEDILAQAFGFASGLAVVGVPLPEQEEAMNHLRARLLVAILG